MSQLSSTDISSVQSHLLQYRKKRVFFDPLYGNNGDELIEMGSREALYKAGVELVDHPQEAEAIVINGGAGMTDIWLHGFRKLETYNRLYSNVPLLVMPSSFMFKDTNFAELFRDRVAPAFVYARERYSLELLKNCVFPGDVHLGLDHDMAFHLEDTSYIKSLSLKSAQKHILIVERNDPESTTGSYKSLQEIATPRSAIPQSIKHPIRQHILRPLAHKTLPFRLQKKGVKTAFAQESQKKVLEEYPAFGKLPVYASDISERNICSFKYFGQLITESAVVVSSRLHVAILAAILGKPTYIKSGSYHKIRGIYEYSLASRINVKLIP